MPNVFIPSPEGVASLFAQGGIVYNDMRRRIIKVDAAAKQACPVDTGRLRQSIRFKITSFPNSVVGVVGSDVNYALPVHQGTRPHTIRPRVKQALFWKGADHPVASVQHPGTKPNPFLLDALTAAGD